MSEHKKTKTTFKKLQMGDEIFAVGDIIMVKVRAEKEDGIALLNSIEKKPPFVYVHVTWY